MRIGRSNLNPNVKGVGQECPTHTCNGNIDTKRQLQHQGRKRRTRVSDPHLQLQHQPQGSFNRKGKNVGQECPTHTCNGGIDTKRQLQHQGQRRRTRVSDPHLQLQYQLQGRHQDQPQGQRRRTGVFDPHKLTYPHRLSYFPADGSTQSTCSLPVVR